jgi:hypothetical protein
MADRGLVAAVRFFYVDEDDTRIGDIGIDVDAIPDAIDQFVVLAQPGDVLSPPPRGTLFGRVALAIAVAPSAAECRKALDGLPALDSR